MNSNEILQTESAIQSLAYEEAEMACRGVLGKTPNDVDALRLLGRIQQATGRRADAIDTWYRAVSYTHLTLPTNREV